MHTSEMSIFPKEFHYLGPPGNPPAGALSVCLSVLCVCVVWCGVVWCGVVWCGGIDGGLREHSGSAANNGQFNLFGSAKWAGVLIT